MPPTIRAPGRCPRCSHVFAIHYPTGACPRWAGVTGLTSGTRVCIRVGAKWPGAEGHVIAYFADCVDGDSGMVLVWDLTADVQFEAPMLTVRSPWSRPATNDERADARDELAQRTGDRVDVLRNLS